MGSWRNQPEFQTVGVGDGSRASDQEETKDDVQRPSGSAVDV